MPVIEGALPRGKMKLLVAWIELQRRPVGLQMHLQLMISPDRLLLVL
jgi:hypothetical protein